MPKLTLPQKLASTVLALYTLYVLVVAFAVPPVVVHYAKSLTPQYLGEEISIEKISINPFTLTITLTNVSLTAESTTDILAFAKLRVNLQIFPLFLGHLSLKEIYLEESHIYLGYLGQSRFNFSHSLETLMAKLPPKDETKPSKGIPTIQVATLTLKDNSFIFDLLTDSTEAVNVIHFDKLNFTIENFATNIKENKDDNKYSVTLQTPIGGEISWNGVVEFAPFVSHGEVIVKGISLGNTLQPVAERFPIILEGGLLGVTLPYELVFDENPRFALHNSSISVDSSVFVDPTGSNSVAEVSGFSISGIDLSYLFNTQKLDVLVDSIGITGEKLVGKVYADKSTNISRLLNFSSALKQIKTDLDKESPADDTTGDSSVVLENGVKVDSAVVDSMAVVGKIGDVDSAVSVDSTPKGLDLTWLINSLVINYESILFADSTYTKEVTQNVRDIDLEIKHISSKTYDTLTLALGATINDEGTVSVGSKGTLFPFEFGADIQLSHISFLPAQPYLAQMSYLKIRQGMVSGTYRAEVKIDTAGLSTLSLAGDTKLGRLTIADIRNGARVFSWRSVEVTGLFIDIPTRYIRIKGVGVDNPRLNVALSKEGKINLLSLVNQNTEAYAKAEDRIEEQIEYQQSQKMPNVFINRVAVRNARADISDLSPIFSFTSDVESFTGIIKNLSTFKKTPLLFEFSGILNPDAEVKIWGNGLLLLKYPKVEVSIATNGVNLPEFTPYSVTYAGYKIDKGEVLTQMHYLIQNDSLIGENHIEVSQMEFGEEVESEDAIKLPYKLGVALLKDKNGVITIDVPVEGSLSDPEFKIKKLVWKSIGQILKSAVASPFRGLANLVHGGEDMDQIFFEPGDTTLSEEMKGRLGKIKEVLDIKPEFLLDIRGHYQPQDSVYIKEGLVAAKIEKEQLMVKSFFELEPEHRRKKVIRYIGTEAYKNHYAVLMQDSAQLPNTSKESIDSTIAEQAFSALAQKEVVSTSDLDQLGSGRGESVYRYLIDSLSLPKTRVFMLQPDAAPGDSSAVSLTLKHE